MKCRECGGECMEIERRQGEFGREFICLGCGCSRVCYDFELIEELLAGKI